MVDWETDWSRDVLERIVVLLFSLAGLADLAARAPFLRRRKVLEILGRGEAEARAFLIGNVSSAGPVDALETAGDAARLAARLRALAMLLCILLARRVALPGVAVPRDAIGRRVGRVKPAGRAGRQAALSVPDTS